MRLAAFSFKAALIAGAAVLAMGLAQPSSAQTPKKGGTLNVIIQPEPPILMLGLNQQGPTQTVAGKIYQGLLTYDEKLNPMPGLAKSWEVSPDGLTYTFHLQEGVKWHDGKPFTAEDVVFTTKTFLPETHPRARVVFGRCESISAPDANTVVFKLKEPFAPFLGAFELSSAPIVPKHIYDGTDYRSNPANATPIGTGPFKFKEWQKGSFIHLVRNDEYWKPGKPYLDDIYFRVIPDAAQRAVALETGVVQQSQFSDIENFDVPRLKALPTLNMTTKGYEFFAPHTWIEINNRVGHFQDKRFRQAISYALDRQFIRDKIWFGLGKIPTGPIGSSTKFYDGNVTKYPLDLKKATALLDEMGLKPDAKGVRASVKFLNLPYGETWSRMAEYVKQSLSKVGIEVQIEATDVAGWSQRVSNWDYEMTFDFVYQYGDPALGVSRTYVSSNIKKGVLFNNTMGYTNPKVDELFEKAAVALTPADRQKYYTEVQKILADEVPVVWLLEMEFPTFTSKKLHDAITTAIGVNESYDSAWLE